MTYQIFIKNRNYSDWDFKDVNNENIVNVDNIHALKAINPVENKLFSRDVITIDENNNMSLSKSIIRNSQTIAGILVLEGNKMYGRTENKKKLLYKCIPDDRFLPVFLVPYELKIGFSKNIVNKYVVFKFEHWNDKHPRGILVNTLGNVDNLEAFYEYQLYCKSLYVSMTEFSTNVKRVLNKIPHEEFIDQIRYNPNYQVEDRTNRRIITIDPPNSVDFDDGFGIESYNNDNGEQIGWVISIYIANVYLWLETLELWKTFSHRVSTIYLPDRKRPMLPTVLSDTLCSLQEKQNRFALVMDIHIDMEGNFIEEKKISYKNALICVHKNYNYEDKSLLYNESVYTKLFNLSYLMDKYIKNSYDLVSYWMILMNAYTGITMINNKVGIFRSVIIGKQEQPALMLEGYGLSDDTKRVIKHWNNISGHYMHYDEDKNINHDLINVDSLKVLSKTIKRNNLTPYIHITSPIRRLVDLLNQIILYEKYNIVKNVSNDAKEFLNEWISKLEYVNVAMRSIRKVQTDCNLLHNCSYNPQYLENSHNGVVFNKVKRNNGAYNYMVYLDKLKLVSRITVHHELNEYSKNNFKLYLFNDEETLKQKIKLQLV